MERILPQHAGSPAKLTRKALALRLLIGFFAVMAALTVIARAADALTLPQVHTTGVSSGKLTHVVLAEGVLEAANELTVKADAGLTVERVHVVEGQTVAAGETLLSYDQGALSEEIDAAKLDLRKLEISKQEEQLGADTAEPLDPSARLGVQRAEENILAAQDEAQRGIVRAQEDLAIAQDEVVKAEENLAYVERTTEEERREAAEKKARDARRAYHNASDDSDFEVESAQAALDAALQGDVNGVVDDAAVDAAHRNLESVKTQSHRGVGEASDALRDATDELQKMLDTPLSQEDAVKAAQAELDAARANEFAMERKLEDANLALQAAMVDAWRDLEDAQAADKEARRQRADSKRDAEEAQARRELRLEGIDLDIEVKKRELERLEGYSAAARLKRGGVLRARRYYRRSGKAAFSRGGGGLQAFGRELLSARRRGKEPASLRGWLRGYHIPA